MARALRLALSGRADNPTAWLIQVAKNRVLDQLRRDSRLTETTQEVEIPIGGEADATFAGEIRDDQLRMIFTCCHPLIPEDGQIALTLKTVGASASPRSRGRFSPGTFRNKNHHAGETEAA